MASLVKLLYLLSSGLLIPVVLLLLLFVLGTLLECGGFLRELQERRRRNMPCRLEESKSFTPDFFQADELKGLLGLFVRQARDHLARPDYLDKIVADLEIEASRRLARMSLFLRVGPMLGLMGTLIPLGPALIGLSQGNMNVMAENLVVAFSTTVLGLAVGGLGYAMWLVRRQWYARDLSDMEFILQQLGKHREEAPPNEQ